MTRACLCYAREVQNVTQAGPKSHTSRAKMSHKGQNVTQSCYNASSGVAVRATTPRLFIFSVYFVCERSPSLVGFIDWLTLGGI